MSEKRPHFAKLIQVLPGKGMWIDGEMFPWFFTEEVEISASRADINGVTLKIVAERVEVLDHNDEPPS